ncbi:DUF6503 family protein [Eudoraea sp.]|uniref:DUF6503 family protein n=1 Tax=Eudoraea sp. TaxID=1979955 RepID=UPI003C76BF77
MKNYFFLLIFLTCFSIARAQDITASELLDKSIEFHDPDHYWGEFQGTLSITMTYPDGRERLSDIIIDLPKQYFKLTSQNEGNTFEQSIDKGECVLMLNGDTNISDEDVKKYRLTCERTQVMKNYYQYLYGLPMKLKDKGTNLDNTVLTKTFKGKEYLVLRVTYDESVGDDIWYFYFDPDTFAMEVYQFYHDESKNDGEYILLSGIENISTIKMPKVRTWYYNKDDKLLGTDTLHK